MSYAIDVILMNEDDLSSPSFDEFAAFLQPVANYLELNKEICIKIVSAEESQFLNNTYRQKDKPTNVLSFPSEIPDFVGSPLLGDLAICADVVLQEAQEQNKSVKDHWAHLSIHGCLHLLGYDHIEDEEAETMERLEADLLAELSISDPY
ncbi:rRNA maturation RNase YbeY [Marinicella rhabdoformis]|uniref:rRNA maturation RNase YbeY n=1 Tax=Marinicella rhabdoformis TaxID=2580566 RepID=UPI0012AEB89E|nr:rRNA maturation RNase YbeY [Marinicella rhabdoformis]